MDNYLFVYYGGKMAWHPGRAKKVNGRLDELV